jgi:hypothetical protein
MKQSIKKWIAMPAFLFIAIAGSAQSHDNNEAAPWVSDKGYWVVESNKKAPLEHIIRFYTNDDQLVYTEKLEGVRLNVDRKKVKMKLKSVLEASLVSWERNKKAEEDKQYVITALR